MQTNNVIATTEKGRAVYVGGEALKYADLRLAEPLCYPEGHIEKGDILIYFSCDRERIKAICSKEIVRGCVSKLDEINQILIISEILSDDVSPIVQKNFCRESESQIVIETIYERTEIMVKWEDDTVGITADGLGFQGNVTVNKEIACIIRSGEMIYFTPAEGCGGDEVCQILESYSFSAYINEIAMKEMDISRILRPAIWDKISQTDFDVTKAYIKEFGKSAMVEKRGLVFGGRLYYIYSFYDRENLVEELVKKTESYNLLAKKDKDKAVGELHYNSFRLWGSNGKLMELERLLQKSSITNSTVLLVGESGTGKTFLAREIHNCSKRAAMPFVHVNCAAIPYHLMESELFGYEEGAFTGAKKGGKIGLFEMAFGGTLFLDEITEIPLPLQGKLLEVLQSKTFFRVGGTKKLTVDVRLIAATNKNLKEMVIEKNFREDLYYRINVFPIEIPPLRERMESIQAVIGDILPDICDRLEIEPVIVGYQALEKLKNYYWPGNIRELENVLEKAAILCDGKLIMPEDVVLPEHDDFILKPKTLRQLKESCEREAIKNALNMFHWDKIRAAQYLDIGRTNMFEKIKKYGLDEEEAE